MCAHKVESGGPPTQAALPIQVAKPKDIQVHKVVTKKLSSLFDLSFKDLVLHIFTRNNKWVPVSVVNREQGIFEYARIKDIKKTYGIGDAEIENARHLPTNQACAETLGPRILEIRLESLLTRAIIRKNRDEMLQVLGMAAVQKKDPIRLLTKVSENLATEYKQFAENITNKCAALQKLLPNIDPAACFKLVTFAEATLQEESQKQGAIHVKKSTYGLSHSLLIDFSKKTFSVLLKGKGPLEAYGTSGKVTSIIELLPTNEARFAVQKVTLDDATMSPFAIECEKKYGGAHTVASYNKGDVSKTTITYEEFDCDLVDAINDEKIKTVGDVLNVLDDLAGTVKKMHSDGVIHGDIKVENGLFKRVKDRAKGKLIDCEISYKPEAGGVPAREDGYGTSKYTSPEVIIGTLSKKADFSSEERKAQDMYAFGMVALSLLLNRFDDELVGWFQDVQDSLTEFYELPPKERVHAAVETQWLQTEFPTDRLKILRKKERTEELTFNDRLEQLVLNLLHPDVEKRLTVDELIDAIFDMKFDFKNELAQDL